MRSYWIRVALKPVSGIPKEERNLDTEETQKKKANVAKEAKAEVIFLRAEECQGVPPTTGRRKRQRKILP